MKRARTVLKVLRGVSEETGDSVAQIALAWLLTRPYVTSVIIGARSREQLEDNLAATDVRLTAEPAAALDASSELPQEYLGWMIARQGMNRRPTNAI